VRIEGKTAFIPASYAYRFDWEEIDYVTMYSAVSNTFAYISLNLATKSNFLYYLSCDIRL